MTENRFVSPEEIEGPTIWVCSVGEFEAALRKYHCPNPQACRQEFEENGVTGWWYDWCRCPCRAHESVMVRMEPSVRAGFAMSA